MAVLIKVFGKGNSYRLTEIFNLSDGFDASLWLGSIPYWFTEILTLGGSFDGSLWQGKLILVNPNL